jgi:signal transduction histidine kinase/ActR/RegA family two-component response regulator
MKTTDYLSEEKRVYWEKVLKQVLDGKKHREEFLYELDDEISYYDISFNPIVKDGETIGITEFTRDITDRKKAEEEMLKLQKLESIGVLAGGIAHDFNNILTGIMGNISLAEVMLESDREPAAVLERLQEAEKASMRARDLTQQLLTFSKGGAPIKKPADMAEILQDITNFALSGSSVRCEFAIPEDLWKVEIDESQMSQVINSLVINAKQAMPGGGIINISAENVEIDSGTIIPLKKGTYIKITVKDHGIGIPESIIQRVFEPFFTTKQAGSGLGLATSYSIIIKHGGYITVESEMGVGTTFYVYLPAFAEEKLLEKSEKQENSPKTKSRILVMDDEEIIRELLKDMLSSVGYQVDTTEDGADAINLYQQAVDLGERFDAVILDLTVPGGMGGIEAMQKLTEIDPGVKAIVSSGYFNDPVMSDFRKYGFKGVIAKPYKAKDLRKILQNILEA